MNKLDIMVAIHELDWNRFPEHQSTIKEMADEVKFQGSFVTPEDILLSKEEKKFSGLGDLCVLLEFNTEKGILLSSESIPFLFHGSYINEEPVIEQVLINPYP